MSKFIVFEGIDGCGKDTQMEALADKLTAEGETVRIISNISTTPSGDNIRNILLGRSPVFVSTRQIASMYMADLYYTDDHIKDLLAKGITVICGRWTLSTLTYATDLSMSDLKFMAEGYKELSCSPDLIVFLDVSLKVATKRIIERDDNPDYFEACHEKLSKIYCKYAHIKMMASQTQFTTPSGEITSKFKTVDGDNSVDEVGNEVMKHYKECSEWWSIIPNNISEECKLLNQIMYKG